MGFSNKLATSTLLAVLIGTATMVVLFFATRTTWYDPLALEHRISFWAEAFVAYGTLVLAIVTWTSVRETQLVIAAEDLRFRQSRMPMVAIIKTHREAGGVFVRAGNVGDGPARNVRLTFDAHTTLRWNAQGLAVERNEIDETDVAISREAISSFMPIGEAGECEWLFGAREGNTMVLSPESSVTFRKLTIEYEDVFGALYVTEHDHGIGGEIVPLRFKWVPPEELVPSLL